MFVTEPQKLDIDTLSAKRLCKDDEVNDYELRDPASC